MLSIVMDTKVPFQCAKRTIMELVTYHQEQEPFAEGEW